MKRLKRILSTLLTVALLLSTVTIPIHAEGVPFTITAETVSANAGDGNVAVDIVLSGNPGISGYSFCVNYDTENLVLVDATVNNEGYKVVSHPSGYGINLAWAGTQKYSENGCIATLYFNVPSNAKVGDASIEILYRSGYDSFYVANEGIETDIPIATVNGKVSIEAAEETETLLVSVGNVYADYNNEFVVPVSVNDKSEFNGFSFCVDYDKTRLRLESTEIVPEGYKVITTPEGHDLAVAWTSSTAFKNNGEIVKLHFSLVDNAEVGKAYINISFREGYDSFYKAYNGEEIDIDVALINGYAEIGNHNFGEWVITKPASCTETGKKKRTCLDDGCSKVEEEIIPKTAHNYQDAIVPPTCTLQGYTSHTCSTCGYSYNDTFTSIVQHTAGEWEIDTEPKCESTGLKVKKCSVCGATLESEIIPANGHSFDEWFTETPAQFNVDGVSRRDCQNCDHFETKRIPKLSESHVCDFTGTEEIIEEATCTVNGSKKVFCSEKECGNFKTVEIVAEGHKFGDWYTTVEPKFNEDGEQRRDCKNCDHYEINILPKLSESHTCTFTGTEEIVDEPTCTESGSKKVYCSHPDCDKFTTVSVDPKGHTNGTWEVSVEATCTENGIEVIKCTVCHTELQSRSIDSLGHSWDAGVVTKPSDCLNTGEKTFTCTECDATDVRDLPKTGHTSGEWVTTSEPTCDTIGRKELYCTVCLELIGTDTIQTTGHELGKWETVLEPTETVAGRAERSCANCDYVESKDIEPTGVVPKILASSSVGGLGSRVNVTISIADNPGIVSATLTVKYDTNVLTLVEVKDLGNLGTQVHKPQLVSPYTLAWANDTLSENITFNGGLVTLVFEISNNAEIGDYPIEISYNYDNYDIYNMNAEKVKFYTVDGNISIVDVIIGDVNSDGLVNNLDRLTITRFLANWEGYTEETINMVAADVNCDNVVNNLDRMILTRHLANWEGYEFLPYAN